MKYIIYTDGGSRGNPGYAASAFVIKNEEEKIMLKEGIYIGIGTNNEAEYTAVLKALERVEADNENLESIDIEFRADSQLVVNQLMDNWKVKNGRIKNFYSKIKKIEEKFSHVTYKYITRELNYEADEVVNKTLDSKNL